MKFSITTVQILPAIFAIACKAIGNLIGPHTEPHHPKQTPRFPASFKMATCIFILMVNALGCVKESVKVERHEDAENGDGRAIASDTEERDTCLIQLEYLQSIKSSLPFSVGDGASSVIQKLRDGKCNTEKYSFSVPIARNLDGSWEVTATPRSEAYHYTLVFNTADDQIANLQIGFSQPQLYIPDLISMNQLREAVDRPEAFLNRCRGQEEDQATVSELNNE